MKGHAVGQEAGFTLVELMIVVAIITIAVGLALPNYSLWQAESKLRQATTEIASQLTVARMAAMNRNRSVDVTIQDLAGIIHVSAVISSTGVPVINDTPIQIGTSLLASPIMVSFSSMGMRTSAGTGVQTIAVCNTYKRQYTVTIIPGGKVDWSFDPSTTPCP